MFEFFHKLSPSFDLGFVIFELQSWKDYKVRKIEKLEIIQKIVIIYCFWKII